MAADARASLRHKALLTELETLQDLLEPRHATLDEEMLASYQSRLRSEVLARSSQIDLPSTVRHAPVDIDALYVTPTLKLSTQRPSVYYATSSELTHVPYQRFLRSVRRRVVLGHPGAGKSTLAVKVCYDVARDNGDYRAGALVTPLRVELRKYHASGVSLMAYCDRLIAADYMIGSPTGTFAQMLFRRRLLVLFDGLDEILDSEARRGVRTTIETFCRQFPGTDVIVTSRIVGYEQAPLNASEFDIAYVEEFDDDQVRDYASNWFAVDASVGADGATDADAFCEESRSVDDLRRNPLLLALLCALYRGEGYIPDNLPDVYERCSLLLFETWDRSRGIDIKLPFTRHIQPALEDLACWMYSDSRMAGGVTERQAVTQATGYLKRWRFAEVAEARAAAQDFVEFCRGRAWVFSDQQSTSPTGEDLFAFIHRTFMEYFTAMYLVSTHSETAALIEKILPRIKRREWDVVCRITLQMHARGRLGGADDVVILLVERVGTSLIEERGPILETLLRSVGAMVPSPDVLARLGVTVTEAILERKGMSAEVRRTLIRLVEQGGDEVRSTIARAVVARAIEMAVSGDRGLGQAASELIASLAGGDHDSLRDAASDAMQSNSLSLMALAEDDLVMARNLVMHIGSEGEFIRRYGPVVVFARPSAFLAIRNELPAPIETAVDLMLRDEPEPFVAILQEVAGLWDDGLPHSQRGGAQVLLDWGPALEHLAGSKDLAAQVRDDPELSLGLWTLLAATAELGRRPPCPDEAPEWVTRLIRVVAARRAEAVPDELISEVFADPERARLVTDWCRGADSIFR